MYICRYNNRVCSSATILFQKLQVQRRLAQNREAARKSRLRKKVGKEYVFEEMPYFEICLKTNLKRVFFCVGLCSAVRNKSFEAGSIGARA